MKFVRLLFLATLCALGFPALSQLTVGTVDPGPYTPGSSIAATFSIGSTCIRPGNRFNLYLVRPDGTEVTAPIGFYNGFYSTFVNGIIPTGTPAEVGYKLRIKSTTPILISTDSAPFDVQAGTPVNASVSSFPELAFDAAGKAEVFGYCPGRDNTEFNFSNTSTLASIVTGTVKNEITNAFETPLAFNSGTPNTSFIARLGHYTTVITSKLNGTVGTRAYLIVNNNINNSFGTTGSNIVCLPGGFLQYTVDLSDAGIKNNFPGTTYEIKWGDGNGAPEIFTICDLATGFVRHEYTRTSCGQPVYNTGNGNQFNVFGINIAAVSPFCPGAGGALSTYVRVVTKPQNSFTYPPFACTGSTVNFTNNSVAGQTETNTQVCTDNNVRYNWFVENVRVAINQPKSYILSHQFTAPGKYKIRLESVTTGQCNGVPIELEICVQDPPKPDFEIVGLTTGCAPFTVNVLDKSFIDASCPGAPTPIYNWIVTNANGVRFTNFTNNVTNPAFPFSDPGVYTIALEINSGACGTVRSQSPSPIVIINGQPTAVLSADVKLCALGTYRFDNTPNTPTTTTLTGTQAKLSDTYTWEVTDLVGNPLTSDDYTFENGTGANDQYPYINFKKNIAYKISVRHKNTCNTIGVTDSQIIEFFPAPQVNVGPDQVICFSQNSISLNASITGTIISGSWIGGTGTFGDRNNNVTTYVPSATERNSGSVTLTYTATTALAQPCTTVSDGLTISIKPEIKINSNSAVVTCTGNTLNYAPSSTSATSYTWTASGTASAGGFNNSTGPSVIIQDLLTNSDQINPATVTYVITPIYDGCDGTPFNLTVTVNPRPLATATPTNPIICSGSQTAIQLGSTLTGTTYTWTSSSSNANITGNTQNSTPTSSITIDDLLANSGTVQGNVTYTITPITNGCPGTPVLVTIAVDPAVTVANAGIDENICATNSYSLKGNPAIVGTGIWTIEPTNAAVTIADPTSPTTLVTGLTPGQTYVFRWTISASGACNPSSDVVTIAVNEPTIPGTTSTPVQTVCANANTGTITLTGNLGTVLRWESSLDGVNWITAVNTNTTTSYTFNNLAFPTQFRAVVQNGGCTIENSTPITINISPATTIAAAGTDQVLCSQTETTLKANAVATGETGLWTLVSGNSNAQISTASNNETTVTGLIAGETYVFRWTITGNSPCGPTYDEVSVVNNPLIAFNTITTTAIVCNGQQLTVDGSVPTGGDGTYTYTWESKLDAGAWTTISNETGEDLTITLTTSGTVSFRRNVASGGCTATSNEFPVTVQQPISNNTISADQPICSGSLPTILTGSQPSGGDGAYLYQWQSSLDGTTWANIAGALTKDYQPPTLTQTTFYRRTVGTLACSGTFQNSSNPVEITVNLNAKAEFTWTTDVGCAPYNLPIITVPYPDRNATYTWYANNVVLPSTGSTFPGYVIANTNQNVTIKLVVTSSLGCAASEFEHTFSTRQTVPASFTPATTTICGPLAVNFVNTSLQTAGATFKWDFGNGQQSNDANPQPVTFQPDPSGKDITYTITLYSETLCGITSITGTVLVKSPPKPIFSPNKTSGCSDLLVSFTNNSPLQANTTYTFDFGDGTPPEPYTDRRTITHTYRTLTNIQTFNATLTAQNECGTVTTEPYSIVVTPNTVVAELVVNGNQLRGCAPFTVTFDNNSTGANEFSVDFGDGTIQRESITAPEQFTHTFTEPGTYTVVLTATSGCNVRTTSETITVLPQPLTDFTADQTLGCTGLEVKFRNTTQNGVSYNWDFGDGSTSTDTEPTHTYDADQEYYTVTLTATNILGCSKSVTKNQFIHIVQPPLAAFSVNPSTIISIPNYTFNFEDQSTNTPTIWQWDFGDGTTSALKNPNHTYPDTGTYKVTLKVLNQQGCFTTTFKNVRINGVPGYLFVPNSFIPGGERPELRVFKAVGSGIQSWRFSVFNKWGQLLWESTKLEEGGPVEGWDGTYKGVAQPQGIYFWKLEVKLINGTEWKGMTYDKKAPRRTGEIYLIR